MLPRPGYRPDPTMPGHAGCWGRPAGEEGFLLAGGNRIASRCCVVQAYSGVSPTVFSGLRVPRMLAFINMFYGLLHLLD